MYGKSAMEIAAKDLENLIDAAGTKQVQIDELKNSQIKGVEDRRYKIIGGAIRNDGTGWSLIDDPTHKNINLSDVYIDPSDDNFLRLDHNFNAVTVGTLVITADETFSKMGLQTGNSGGKGYNLLDFAAPLSLQTAGSTTILSGHKYHMPTTSISQLGDGTGFTITHGATSTTFPPIVTLADGGTNGLVGGEVRSEFTLTTITVRYYQHLHGYIRYNAGTSNFDMDTNNVDKANVSWDSTNTAVRVEHSNSTDTFGVNISGSGELIPYIYTQNASSFLIRFKDFNGNVITTPNANMKFNFVRLSKVRSTFPAGLRCNIWRGMARVKPSSIVEQFGNFWILGINQTE